LSAILRWLANLFGWDDIWDNHKILESILTNTLEFGQQWADEHLDEFESMKQEKQRENVD
jgi:hypothetical protein